MPELPEVEVVRRGLDRWAGGRPVSAVEVLDVRSTRRHDAGPEDFSRRLAGARLAAPERRGKYLWIPLAGAAEAGTGPGAPDRAAGGDDGREPACGPAARALVAHLGMSGQLLVSDPGEPDPRHLRIRLLLEPRDGDGAGICGDGAGDGSSVADEDDDRSRELRFVDQRIFGGLFLDPLIPAADRPEQLLPASVAHIARDPLDPFFDPEQVHRRLRARRTGLKRALLDQSLVSGIGNIYADEALWRARLHYARPTETLNRTESSRLFDAVRRVMEEALAQGGTSFDSLYVNVNGDSGRFTLNVYGRERRPGKRCGGPIVRERFMNRSNGPLMSAQDEAEHRHGAGVCTPRGTDNA